MLDLTGIIGISDSIGETATLYVCDLPGISIDNLSGIADNDQVDVTGVWEDVSKRAAIRFKTSFTSALNEKFHICKPDIIECIIEKYKELLSVSIWYLCGAELMVERVNSDRLNRYTTIDRKRAIELRDYFYNEFDIELKQAVLSINPNDSECLPDEDHVEKINPIMYKESVM